MRTAPYSTRWDKESRWFRQKHPLCVECRKHGRVTASAVVDHIIPHHGNKGLFWDKNNWQALCIRCHNKHKRGVELRGFDHAVGIDGWPTHPEHPANRK